MTKAIAEALYSKLTGDATLTALLAAKTSVYYELAPSEAAYPLVVFNRQTGRPVYTFGGKAFDNQLWQIKGVVHSATANVADEIAAHLDALLTNGTLTISGGELLDMRRESDVSYVENESGEQYHHSGGLYRLIVA